MASDDLNTPLGRDRSKTGRPARRLLALSAVLAGSVATISIAAALLFADPRTGEPFAVATIPPAKPTPARLEAPAAKPQQAAAPPAGSTQVAENGVTVVRAGSDPRGGPLVIKVPQALGLSEVAATDRRLIEATRYGPLPRIAADGARSSEVYARPPVFGDAIQPGTPRLAIAIGGLGSNRAATDDVIAQMPAAVTLAFTPYGEALDDAVARAKAAGHEVLLQLPTDGVAGRGDPAGPHLLRAGATPGEMLDDLHWLMSRMSGYVGVSSRGGAFTADRAAMTTLLQEVGGRGLLYVEDTVRDRAAAPVAASLASNLGVPDIAASVVLDAQEDPAALRAALVRLEADARDKGFAVGVTNGIPSNLGAIATFAHTLQAKGVALVPVSALVGRTVPTAAAAP